MTESRPKRLPAWVTPVVAVGLVAVVTWSGIRYLSARAMAQEIPALPELAGTTSAVARQLTEADARARRRPRSGDAVGGLAMAYHANTYHEHARSAYQLAMRVDPNDFRWPYYQSVLDITAGQNERAVALLKATLELNADYPHAWARLGELSFRKGLSEDAESAFIKALELAPGHRHATLGMARLVGLRGEWSEVVTLLGEALRADPGFGPAHDLLAVAYEQLGSAEGVRRHEGLGKDAGFQMDDPLMNELWELSSTSSVLVTQAQIAGDRNPQRALGLLRRAVQVDPGDKDVRLALGRFLARPGVATKASLEEAKIHFEAGLELDPAYVNMRHEYAQALYALGELAAAETQWQQIIEAEPQHAMALMSLGQLYLRQRNRPRALEFYRRGLDVPPDTPFSLGDPAMAHYVFAKVSLAAGDTDAALESFRLAVEHNPRLNDAYRDHATLL
ncbi:MAG: tetratricopeptide repeat protein, partial [Planctomycetota bacterium]